MGIDFANSDTAFASIGNATYITPGDTTEARNRLIKIVNGNIAGSGFYPNMPSSCFQLGGGSSLARRTLADPSCGSCTAA